MRYAQFVYQGRPRAGIVRDGHVEPIANLGHDRLHELVPFLFGRERRNEEDALETEAAIPLADVQLMPPLDPVRNVFCVGRNYMGHAEEIARARGTELKLPSVPTFFTKATTAVSAPDSSLHLEPKISREYDYEAELGVIIGTHCKNVPRERALDVVFGYTCINDITARDLQREHVQWFKGKSLDESCPIGPWIVTADEIGDPQDLEIRLRVNGETKQSSNTSHMIFSVADIIASLSLGMTLEAGDIIATGTPDGVGFARTPPEFLQDGDVVEVDIPRIGVLRNAISFAA
jgi:2-keto-4-pentenoate hydratase/2-oxohepta-3-ene-1,7-dioic acid hydratase in catechol pathway